MTSHLNCPNCSKPCRIKPEHAGKRVACPSCKSQFLVTPTAPPIAQIKCSNQSTRIEIATGNLDSADHEKSTNIQANKSHKRNRTKISTVLAFCMLGVSLIFPLVICGLIVMGFVSAARRSAQEETNSWDMGSGSSMVFESDGRVISKSKTVKEAEKAGTVIGIFLGSVCCPGVPYILVMLVLGTAYFAFRSAGY